jgi:hypothetical protein
MSYPEYPESLPESEPKKKSNTTMIIAVVVVVVLCCCCLVGGGLGYYLYNNGDELFGTGALLPLLSLL